MSRAPILQVLLGFLNRVEDLDRVDRPVRLLEGLWVVAHVLLAGRSQSRALWVAGPHVSGPSSAKGGVEDQIVVFEVVVNVAPGSAVELGQRGAPVAWVWRIGGDIRGDGVSREEPRGNVVRGPLRSVHSSANGVEPIAVVLVVAGALSATFVGVTCVAVRVTSLRAARNSIGSHAAASRGV